jgi:hypothetical protein
VHGGAVIGSLDVKNVAGSNSWRDSLTPEERAIFKTEEPVEYPRVVEQGEKEQVLGVQPDTYGTEKEKAMKLIEELQAQLQRAQRQEAEMKAELQNSLAFQRRGQLKTFVDKSSMKGKVSVMDGGGNGGLKGEMDTLNPGSSIKKKRKNLINKAGGIGEAKRGRHATKGTKAIGTKKLNKTSDNASKSNDITVNTSFDSQATETDPEDTPAGGLVNNDEEDAISSNGSEGSDDYPVMLQIEKGFIEKEGMKRCMLSVQYEENGKKGPFRTIPATDAVEDDPSHRVLKWIMENKRCSEIWREQVVGRIQSTMDKGLYDGWKGWEEYIKRRVDDGFLDVKCNKWLEDGIRGKGKKSYDEVSASESPLKVRDLEKLKAICQRTGVHDFKTEGNGAYARKGGQKAYILTNVFCDGVEGRKCGKEFVEKMEDAVNPLLCYVITEKTPCKWCKDCKLSLCVACHDILIAVPRKRSCRAIERLDYS